MRTLIWGKTFLRAFRRTVKKHPDLEKDIEETLRLLTEDPFAPRLATHKLKGKLSGSWACSAGYDLRIVFDFVKSASGQEDNILLIEIGTHDEVY
ncbi:MAG TPA: type II toxin-antitoxin system mRNA interferase toxin, RelE/StbE family [Thermodesulfobacteriota bacterium]|nr:type II toxin-antitoxin system mRNA interferase toxin, RelE/StbE family [Thermodesulfobacteriota bacterium]